MSYWRTHSRTLAERIGDNWPAIVACAFLGASVGLIFASQV